MNKRIILKHFLCTSLIVSMSPLNLFAKNSVDEVKISYGLNEESYPNSKNYYNGHAPKPNGFFLSLQKDKSYHLNPIGEFTFSGQMSTNYEENPTQYDSVRDPLSLQASFEISKPLIEDAVFNTINFILGAKIRENGPQINDAQREFYYGLSGVKKIKLSPTETVKVDFSIGKSNFSYRVDDEPAKESTGTPRKKLNHHGLGYFAGVEFYYDSEKNLLVVEYRKISGDDKWSSNNRYTNTYQKLAIGRKISSSTKCFLAFKVEKHTYHPIALAFDDKMQTKEFYCETNF